LRVYKDIHSHPELSVHEERTSAIIAKELRAAGCEVTEHFGRYDKPNLKGYGVIGLMKNGEGPHTTKDPIVLSAELASCEAISETPV
jgi:metal-dependent amidase/aminoacylase/carboxypeptidase family protein